MDAKARLRYSRQMILPEIGEAGQQKLHNASVMVIGVGGLGSPLAMYLAGAGVGEIHLVDHDEVDVSNLPRQVLYKTNHIGRHKVEMAAKQLLAANPGIAVKSHKVKAEEVWLSKHIGKVDVIFDCTDNLEVRYQINAVAGKAARPVVMASAQGLQGQLFSYLPGTACYACVFPQGDKPPVKNCDTLGVLGPVLGVVASMQALEGLKLLLGMPVASENRLFQLDGHTLEWRNFLVSKDDSCPICN